MKKEKNKANIKLKGALKVYMQWPVWLAVLLLCMVLSIYVVDKEAAGIMMIYTAVYFVIALILFVWKRPYIMGELVRFAADHGQVQHSFVKELDIPYGILDLEGRLVWANNELKDIVQFEKTARSSIFDIFEDLTLEQMPTVEEDVTLHIVHGRKNYRVLMRLLDMSDYREDVPWALEDGNGESVNTLIGMYLYDETEIIALKKENAEEKMLVGLLYIDNYEEAFEGADEVRRSLVTAWVEREINKYMQSIDAIIKRLEKDKYIFVFKQKYLSVVEANRFSILEEIRNLNIYEMTVTISIGVGVGASTYTKNYELARTAIDLALGRGGDQAVVKEGDKISYYGGKSVQLEKNTRVKARVKAHALKEYVETKERVVIMGHSYGDIDSFGSAIGVYRIAKTLGKKAQIVINDVTSSIRPMLERFQDNPDYEEDMFISGSKAQEIVNDQTLLVVVDVNRPAITECKELLELTKTIVILDHHRQTGEAIDAVLSYIEPYASSACEMVAEILQYIGEGLKLKPLEADAMYAGVMIDTNNFLMKTGVRTFEAAAYLRRNGADVTRIRKLFRTEFAEYQAKAHAISTAEVFMDYYVFAVSESEGLDSPSIVAAQTANELLNIDHTKASFVFTEHNGKVHISARSIDELNVQVVMEKLGGGGHMSAAAVQLSECTLEEAMEKVKEVLRDMTEKGDI
ncbi:MAG: DHH family phosphoesterase [Lachnospiraceae bacterium]|nr:DHH family phosphoesterase [Lachnospiraceae bacterium]